MSDSRLRSLAREVALTGGLDARVRLLVERARVGDLPMERLRLAAYLGDAAARRALAPHAPKGRGDIHRYLTGLTAFGVEACQRAAIAVGRAADPQLESVRQLLDDLTLWLECPCGAHDRDVQQTARRTQLGEAVAPLLLWAATRFDERADTLTAWRQLWQPVTPVRTWEDGWVWTPRETPHRFVQDQSDLVCRTLEARLVPWALA